MLSILKWKLFLYLMFTRSKRKIRKYYLLSDNENYPTNKELPCPPRFQAVLCALKLELFILLTLFCADIITVTPKLSFKFCGVIYRRQLHILWSECLSRKSGINLVAGCLGNLSIPFRLINDLQTSLLSMKKLIIRLTICFYF